MRRSNRQSPPAKLLTRAFPATVVVALLCLPPAPHAQTAAAGSDSKDLPTLADLRARVTHEGIGDSLLMRRHYQEALEEYRKAPSGSSDVWDKKGIAFQMLSDMEDAIRCYKESLRLEPGNELALNNLATVYELQDKYGKAEALYRRALKLDPTSAKIAMNLGTILMVQDKYLRGAELYKRAMSLDPKVFDQSDGPVFESVVPLEERGAINYYKARQFAEAAMIERAFRYLHRALNEGFITPGQLARDNSFAGLRGNPEFQRLIGGHGK